jgi:hypothetical protein
MSMFGWSLPPGCGVFPGEQTDAVDLSHLLTDTEKSRILGLFWDQDGNLWESLAVTVPADTYAGLPEYTECQSVRVGVFDWCDQLDELTNLQQAVDMWRQIYVG